MATRWIDAVDGMLTEIAVRAFAKRRIRQGIRLGEEIHVSALTHQRLARKWGETLRAELIAAGFECSGVAVHAEAGPGALSQFVAGVTPIAFRERAE